MNGLKPSIRVAVVALRKESVDRNLPAVGSLIMIGVALRKESVDRNKTIKEAQAYVKQSLSARRAWIEIQVFGNDLRGGRVALRKESVDRNCTRLVTGCEHIVALRKESVDRNIHAHIVCMPFGVALRKESVDRNPTIKAMRGDRKASLSARRAWIEIMARLSHFSTLRVALRKESVDRNLSALISCNRR